MLTFLRKIRRSLIDTGATGKPVLSGVERYLLYAIGEIALVVIGILLALAINNWNEELKANKKGQELKQILFDELKEVKEYNEQVLNNEFNVQIAILEEILSKGKNLAIDSFISSHRDYWAIRLLSLTTYIISFTTFYDPNFKLYRASVNDGSISLISEKGFIADLETIYIRGPASMERLYVREAENDSQIKDYVSRVYNDLFVNTDHLENGNWNEEVSRKFLARMADDGELRFKLRHKLGLVKSKKFILESQIMQVLDMILLPTK